ncbi:MAG: YqeG family HAD IIIA-type phosphatase [Oscillospiraceae bacterium]
MSFLPIPSLMLDSIYELKPERLNELGICLLLLDLDNTMAEYSASTPTVHLRNWLDSLKKAHIEPFILSNNRGSRPAAFAKALQLDFIGHARKPNPKTLLTVLKSKGVKPENAAIIGDQIYTDILCGARAGVFSIAVKPMSLAHPLRFLRYGMEMPFRLIYRRK